MCGVYARCLRIQGVVCVLCTCICGHVRVDGVCLYLQYKHLCCGSCSEGCGGCWPLGPGNWPRDQLWVVIRLSFICTEGHLLPVPGHNES